MSIEVDAQAGDRLDGSSARALGAGWSVWLLCLDSARPRPFRAQAQLHLDFGSAIEVSIYGTMHGHVRCLIK